MRVHRPELHRADSPQPRRVRQSAPERDTVCVATRSRGSVGGRCCETDARRGSGDSPAAYHKNPRRKRARRSPNGRRIFFAVVADTVRPRPFNSPPIRWRPSADSHNFLCMHTNAAGVSPDGGQCPVSSWPGDRRSRRFRAVYARRRRASGDCYRSIRKSRAIGMSMKPAASYAATRRRVAWVVAGLDDGEVHFAEIANLDRVVAQGPPPGGRSALTEFRCGERRLSRRAENAWPECSAIRPREREA
jgi:hypothetical protein